MTGLAEKRVTDLSESGPEYRQVLTEMLGTFVLVLVAAGAPAIGAKFEASISREAMVAAPGLAVMALVYAFGDVSGMHINPAVTVAFAMRGAFPWRRVPAYVFAQVTGAILAALLLRSLVGLAGNLGATTPGNGDWRALVAEIALAAILVMVVLGTAFGAKIVGHNGALAVGGWIAAAGLIASPLSGASMNPARSLAPDLVRGHLTTTWIYIIGPLVGAFLSVAVTSILHGEASEAERRAAAGLGPPRP